MREIQYSAYDNEFAGLDAIYVRFMILSFVRERLRVNYMLIQVLLDKIDELSKQSSQ